MSRTPFLIRLFALTVFSAASLLFLHRFPAFAPHQSFSWFSLVFFFLLTIIMYYIGRRAAQSDNQNSFINAVIGLTMLKLMLSAIIIFVYNEWAQPAGILFILPFFGIYLLFTIFETYFMMKLGSMK